ncbi:nuclease Le1 [Lactarius akahatsu]|uniref:Nuclease Le1 n=1 Tax=Lactarius akahatsu TaxID=416441 RepID=A0AAD4LC70_9AGAM|nr:nuclease Le1 [Lactarius akahatsu]
MKLALPYALAAADIAPHGVAASGSLGHQTTGYVAMQFLTPNTLSTVQSILGPLSVSPSDLRPPGRIPCALRRRSSSPRPTISSMRKMRHQWLRCAIQSYTNRVLTCRYSIVPSSIARVDVPPTAHFVGDIGQPLHDEFRNDISAVCSGSSTILHAAWDTGILTKNVNALYGGSAQTWANNLASRITVIHPLPHPFGWVSHINQAALSGTGVPLSWSQEANTYDFSAVFSFVTGQDLCTGTYFTNAIPVIDLQIAKQGYRLAVWLNTIFG